MINAYRVHYKVTKYDYVMVWAEDEDKAFTDAYPEIRNQGDECEILEIEEA